MRTYILFVQITDDGWQFATVDFGDRSHSTNKNFIRVGSSGKASQVNQLKVRLTKLIEDMRSHPASSLGLREVIVEAIAESMKPPPMPGWMWD